VSAMHANARIPDKPGLETSVALSSTAPVFPPWEDTSAVLGVVLPEPLLP
jgi:hypothetical protein